MKITKVKIVKCENSQWGDRHNPVVDRYDTIMGATILIGRTFDEETEMIMKWADWIVL